MKKRIILFRNKYSQTNIFIELIIEISNCSHVFLDLTWNEKEGKYTEKVIWIVPLILKIVSRSHWKSFLKMLSTQMSMNAKKL